MARYPQFIFLNEVNNEGWEVKVINKTYTIQPEEYERQDLMRYVTKLFYDQDIEVDYNKQIRIALDFYLKEHIGQAELAEIEAIKKAEADQIEADRKAKIPKFSWDKSNKKG